MKKIVMALVCLFALLTKAQAYEAGDIVMVDGYPALVIYVDESGKHGLFMTGTALTEEQFTTGNKVANKYAEKYMVKNGIEKSTIDMAEVRYAMPYIQYAKKMKVSSKMNKQIKNDLLPNIGGRGDENLEVVKKFCVDNAVDMATFFPLEYWATQLGEGWFIPGAEDIIYYKQLLTGNGPAKSDLNADISKKEVQEKSIAIGLKFAAKVAEAQLTATLPNLVYKIYTSTFADCPWSKENRTYITIEDHFTNAIINSSFAAANSKKFGAKEEQVSPIARISYCTAYITNAWWAQVVAVKRF